MVACDNGSESSGSRRVPSAVEPTISANMIVSWRRSGEGALPGCCWGSRSFVPKLRRILHRSFPGRVFAPAGAALPGEGRPAISAELARILDLSATARAIHAALILPTAGPFVLAFDLTN